MLWVLILVLMLGVIAAIRSIQDYRAKQAKRERELRRFEVMNPIPN